LFSFLEKDVIYESHLPSCFFARVLRGKGARLCGEVASKGEVIMNFSVGGGEGRPISMPPRGSKKRRVFGIEEGGEE